MTELGQLQTYDSTQKEEEITVELQENSFSEGSVIQNSNLEIELS